ncbi:MAG: SAM-dependent methyltransferase [Gaiellaceae bacterium]
MAHGHAALSGALVVVGTGIGATRLTFEARSAIQNADEVLFLVPDLVSEEVIRSLNPAARSLESCYANGEPRIEAYERMVNELLTPARAGRRVCAAFYGHPGVFVHPSHEAVRRARAEGIEARMQPGISAEDCLFADLALDPGAAGCQSYEATRFLERRPAIEPTAALVLWQIGVLGERASAFGPLPGALARLVERLLELYPPDHEAVLYEAAPYPGVDPVVRRVPLRALAEDELTPLSTLYVPPLAPR